MNCQQAQQSIILGASGEWTPAGTQELDAHLATCSDCREFRDSLPILENLAKHALEKGAPSRIVLAEIRAAAEAQAVVHHPFFRTWIAPRILAYAALLTLLLGGAVYWNQQTTIRRIEEAHTLIVMASDTQMESPDHFANQEQPDNLQDLAHALLIMEGFSDDEVSDSDLPESSPDAEHPATGLQERSMTAPLSRRYV
jgi:hypothetical protein